MGLRYENLDQTTHSLMAEEVQKAIDAGKLYLSNRLTEQGLKDWPHLLMSAAMAGDDVWLSKELTARDCIVKTEARRNRDDFGQKESVVPFTAADILAEGEFNRYYIKALCRRAAEAGVRLVVYRGKDVLNPSPESEGKIGLIVKPDEVEKTLPSRPGSGLTVKLTK